MSTPQDGLANVIADVSFNISGAGALTVPTAGGRDARFQIGPAAAPPAVAGVAGVGIVRTAAGVVDVAVDAGKGAGPVAVASSLQCEFSVAYNGDSLDGTVPMSWTVTEKTGATASTPTLRIFTFHFFTHSLAGGGSVVALGDPAQCTITIRRKKELYPQ